MRDDTQIPVRLGLKVLHVAESAKGGVGSYLDELVPLQRTRYGSDAVRAVLPDAHAAQVESLPRSDQRHFKMARSRALNVVRLCAVALSEIHRSRPDVVHLHSTFAGFALRPLIACLGVRRPRVVYCAHGWAFDRDATVGKPARWIERIERWWARWCDAVVCISRHDMDIAHRAGIDVQRLVCILNGIGDPPAPPVDGGFCEWPDERLRVLFVGRLDRQKGVDVLFEAMNALRGRAHALVAGAAVVADKPLPPVPDNVRVLGWTSRRNVARLCSQAHVLVIPSRWEGFGLVALEAMRAQRAVIASRVGGLPEVVADGVTGYLVEPGNSADLVSAIERMEGDHRIALGRAGRERYIKLFTSERMEGQLHALYLRLLPSCAWQTKPD